MPHEGVFRVWVHRDHLIHGPVVAPDLNYLEAALRGRVPDVHLNVATPPEQADTQLTAKLTVYIRAYLTQRSKPARLETEAEAVPEGEPCTQKNVCPPVSTVLPPHGHGCPAFSTGIPKT